MQMDEFESGEHRVALNKAASKVFRLGENSEGSYELFGFDQGDFCLWISRVPHLQLPDHRPGNAHWLLELALARICS